MMSSSESDSDCEEQDARLRNEAAEYAQKRADVANWRLLWRIKQYERLLGDSLSEEDSEENSNDGDQSRVVLGKETMNNTPKETALLSKAKKRRRASVSVPDQSIQRTIDSLFRKPSDWPEHTNISVVDLFCCIGGFSTGCVAAGHRIVLAIDNDRIALDSHAANHPLCAHECMELGPESEERLISLMKDTLPKSDDGNTFLPWHLHGSPPCQKFSSIMRTRYPNSSTSQRNLWIEEGMEMVMWYLNLVEKCFLTMNLTTWSFEEAPCPQIGLKLKELQRTRSSWLDFKIVDMCDFGIPQTRKRTIGGSPWLIDRLRHDGGLRERRVIKDVLTPPETAIAIRSVWSVDRDNSLDVLNGDTGEIINPNNEKRIRLLNELCFTVMAGCGNMRWYNSQMNEIRLLTIDERKALQTFPSNYILPTTLQEQKRGVGNAIPPLFAQKFMSFYRPA
jgi:site-specific DNA-cytosine methylase